MIIISDEERQKSIDAGGPLPVERSGQEATLIEERKNQQADVSNTQLLPGVVSSEPLRKDESSDAQLQAKKTNILSEEDSEVEEIELKIVVPEWKKKTRKCLDHYVTVIVMTLITVYALFFDDIRVLAFSKSADDVFYGFTLFGMIAFTVEIIIGAIVAEDYYLSFFFWLDVVSTISMIPDCGWIWDPLTGGGGGD